MLIRWSDLGRDWAMFDEFRRRMDSLFSELDTAWGTEGRGMLPSIRGATATWPPINIHDADSSFVVEAELPGVSDKDLDITTTQDVLTLKGERKTEVPEGYSIHRQERGSAKFSRSLTLPGPIDQEKVGARLVDGVLTVTLEKAPETKPKKVTVKP